MTAAELFAAYPAIPHAVAFVELFLCDPDDPPGGTLWDRLTGAGYGPAEMVGVIEELTADEVSHTPKAADALREMADPQFLTYVAGKMGAV